MGFYLTDVELKRMIEKVIVSLHKIMPIRTEADLRCAFVTGLTFLMHNKGARFNGTPWSLVAEHYWHDCDARLDLAIYDADRVRFIIEFKHKARFGNSDLTATGRDVTRLEAVLSNISWQVDFYQVLSAYTNSTEEIRARRILKTFHDSIQNFVTFHTCYVVLDKPLLLPSNP